MVDLSTYAERTSTKSGTSQKASHKLVAANRRGTEKGVEKRSNANDQPLRKEIFSIENKISVNTFVENTQQSLGIEFQLAVCTIFVYCVYQGYNGDLRRTIFTALFCGIGMIMWKVRGLSANQPRISVEDGVPAILAMMREHAEHPLWQAEGCKAIYNLCNPGSKFTDSQDEHRKSFLSGGVVQVSTFH